MYTMTVTRSHVWNEVINEILKRKRIFKEAVIYLEEPAAMLAGFWPGSAIGRVENGPLQAVSIISDTFFRFSRSHVVE